jgi:hypothetical protein
MVANRVKFAVGGPLLDVVNPWLPGRPHQAVAERVGAGDNRIVEVCGGGGYLARLVSK